MESSAVLNIVIDERNLPDADLRIDQQQWQAINYSRRRTGNVFKNYILSTESFVIRHQ